MLNKLFGPAPHEHPDPAQRLAGVAALPPDSKVLAQMLAADPSPDVRAAAAARSSDAEALAAALPNEVQPQVRDALAAALGRTIAGLADDGAARALLALPHCTDAVRAEVALRAQDEARWRAAIDGVGDEAVLVDVALAATRAPVRLAAAERVQAPEALRRLADGARDKDRGVARIARQRLDAMAHRAKQAAIADELLEHAAALVEQPGAVVMAAVELDRRWKALDLGDDAPRRERWVAIERRLQARFEREREAQRAHVQFAQRVEAWLASLQAPQVPLALPGLRDALQSLRAEAQREQDGPALEKLAQAERQIAQWEQAVPDVEAAEALVVEAERMAHAAPVLRTAPTAQAATGAARAPHARRSPGHRSQEPAEARSTSGDTPVAPTADGEATRSADEAQGAAPEPSASEGHLPGTVGEAHEDTAPGATTVPVDRAAEGGDDAGGPQSADGVAADPQGGVGPMEGAPATQEGPEPGLGLGSDGSASASVQPVAEDLAPPDVPAPAEAARASSQSGEASASTADGSAGVSPAPESPEAGSAATRAAPVDADAAHRDTSSSADAGPPDAPAAGDGQVAPASQEKSAGRAARRQRADSADEARAATGAIPRPEALDPGAAASLTVRWQALPLAARTPALTRRFEAALLAIEHRRLEQARAAQQEQGAMRQRLHARLHDAEQALAGGHLQEARAALNEARSLRPAAGQLPKPTLQRLGRVSQQLGELERWQKFGSQTAHLQLCERAEALAQRALAPAALAREVQQLRAEWKKLDAGTPGAPKPLWERFDAACEKAYAPAARHFAELSAQHKQARKQREEFIAAAQARAPELLAVEPRDWRAIERWLREVDGTWHGATLGSIEPGAWKKLDARFKEAVAPAREALAGVRAEAKAGRQALIEQAQALAAKAFDRDAPAQVRALQERWQQQARAMSLLQRDERVLWEQFRTACNAVFDARKSARKEADERKDAHRRTFESLNQQLEQLARSPDADETQLRRGRHELQEQWKRAAAEASVPAGLEARFKSARGAVDDALRRRARAQEAAVWRTLLAKERLCEELDALVPQEPDASRAAGVVESVRRRWDELPPLAPAWEKPMQARREAAERALQDEDARLDLADEIEARRAERRDALLEIELQLGMESPADLQAQRLAMQVKQLRNRFKSTPSSGDGSADSLLLAWCTAPGAADERDHQRCERIVATFERRR